MTLRTEYEFTLPRGYVDAAGGVHRHGVMRLATARDELEPLRNPTITGPDDPRLTVLILARVVTKLGDVPMVTANEIEELFAADLAFLQDFYGVINFGTQEEYEAFLAAQDGAPAVVGSGTGSSGSVASVGTDVIDDVSADGTAPADDADGDRAASRGAMPGVRTTVQRVPSKKAEAAESPAE